LKKEKQKQHHEKRKERVLYVCERIDQ